MRVPAHLGYRRRKSTRAASLLKLLLRLLVGVSLVYLLTATLLLRTVLVSSASMEPTIRAGERILVSPLPYGPRVPLTSSHLPGFTRPGRGDVVLVESPQASDRGPLLLAVDAAVRFFTFQQAGLWRRVEQSGVPGLLVKRVVGLPGDTLRMDSYQAWIRPAGAADYSTEASLSPRAYTLRLPEGTELPRDLPFGGSTAPIVLGEGEYFVLGDNRADSSDSRSWGPVRGERIVGPAILRYFPFRRFGRI